MRFSSTAMAILAYSLSASSAAPTEKVEADEGRMIPDRWVKWNIDDLESNDTSTLEARQQISICTAIITASACYSIGTNFRSDIASIGQMIYDASQGNSCGTFTGTVDGFRYRYRATGNNCDTTAQRKTIDGAIKRHLDAANDQVCGTECWDMSHGGTWDGYLAIGQASVFDDSVYCGPSLSFSKCTNGGGKDW